MWNLSESSLIGYGVGHVIWWSVDRLSMIALTKCRM